MIEINSFNLLKGSDECSKSKSMFSKHSSSNFVKDLEEEELIGDENKDNCHGMDLLFQTRVNSQPRLITSTVTFNHYLISADKIVQNVLLTNRKVK